MSPAATTAEAVWTEVVETSTAEQIAAALIAAEAHEAPPAPAPFPLDTGKTWAFASGLYEIPPPPDAAFDAAFEAVFSASSAFAGRPHHAPSASAPERAPPPGKAFAPADRADAPPGLEPTATLVFHDGPDESAPAPSSNASFVFVEPAEATAAPPPTIPAGRPGPFVLAPSLAFESGPDDVRLLPSRGDGVALGAPPTLATVASSTALAATRLPGSARILVVDDDAAAVALVRHRLIREGYDVDECAEGDDALHRAFDEPYDLILAHTLLAGLDGYGILRHVRAAGLPPRVVLMGHRGDEQAIVRGFALGADDFIPKPFSPIELTARVARVLALPRLV